MQEKGEHLTIIIGATETAEELRRHLRGLGLPHAGSSGHLRNLRRSLVRDDGSLVILCVDLNGATLDRHGSDLQTLLDDQRAFPGVLCSVGVLPIDPDPRATQTGCDVYVADPDEAASVLRLVGDVGAEQHAITSGPLRAAILERLRYLLGDESSDTPRGIDDGRVT